MIGTKGTDLLLAAASGAAGVLPELEPVERVLRWFKCSTDRLEAATMHCSHRAKSSFSSRSMLN